MEDIRIRCPKCDWVPDGHRRWVCDLCNTQWNTFDTYGKCPGCNKVFEDTMCSNCGEMGPHADWYERIEVEVPVNEKTAFL